MAATPRKTQANPRAKYRKLLSPVLYLAGLAPAVWSFWLGAHNQLGADPVRSFEHVLGLWAFRFLLASLAITPIRTVLGVNLVRYRRMLGLLAFAYAAMHVATYVALDLRFDFAILYGDLTKRPFLIFGMLAFIALLPLAATSNTRSIRALGRNWQRLHRLVYVALIAASLHFLMAFKTWHMDALVYVGLGGVLLLLRLARAPWRRARRV
ncbi:protein-methionine-sulfoxide reductase heme-binding subunit MsrQ [Acetobacter sp. TBRC 12305]|uniref:Protein-methionine-sulfoxide reductase heme-binding subunit MsrQ n=1 Tax=Acetobacter garciniae TaxID=2817435 RepID=A0A939KLQ8_9PROT|nr:protein-methionine-sulfoxide reductase heme-binding subunit MsrQ [Acetobacter garciniae]MBO1323710.1 protein-methionine-sulfoxide reductase heme-binding subunit MsrQ [Acetobacter garciniae]MBX0343399.1 protein-methionine-sulfoxide reductase heme-binding subunit MsrQ [Acetobacter garciniae]